MVHPQSIKRTLRLYQPHEAQLQVHRSKTRFNIVCFGRQSGKTTFGLNKILGKAWGGPRDGIYWYVLQTYAAATVAFNRASRLYQKTPEIFAKKPNSSDLYIQFAHGPSVHFKSGNNFEDLRVETLNGCVIDEYRQQDPGIWRVIRPMLSRKKGWCDLLSTSNGHDHFYDFWEMVEFDPEWSRFHAPSTVAPWWTAEEIASSKSTMSDDEFAQEILAEFREFGKGKVYTAHSTLNHSEQNPFAVPGELWSPYLPIIVGLDFNVGAMSWELMQHREQQFYIGDEISVSGTDTEQCAPILIDRVRHHKAGVVLIGDSTGNSNKSSAAGNTDYSILMKAFKDAEIKVTNLTPDSNPLVKDRVNMVNSRLRSADGIVHLTYSPKRCPKLKKDFERVVWKEGAQGAIIEKTKDLTLTHASDAAGYPICHYVKAWKNKPGVLRVITR